MKQLLIKVYDEKHTCIETIVCEKLDACKSNTILFKSQSVGHIIASSYRDLHFPYNIDHWHIMDGLITIYYKNGFELEISRIKNA